MNMGLDSSLKRRMKKKGKKRKDGRKWTSSFYTNLTLQIKSEKYFDV
jgi:hypothetical protein